MKDDIILDIGDLGFEEEQKSKQIDKGDESSEKQKYINDNVIAKGYNLDDLSRSITVRTGLTINEISFDTLKKEIEFYKTQQLKDTYKSTKEIKVGKTNKSQIVTELYAPEHFQLKTATQLENTLMQLENEKKK